MPAQRTAATVTAISLTATAERPSLKGQRLMRALAAALHSEIRRSLTGGCDRCAVLTCLDAEQKREVRGRIVSMVLATDMAVNFTTVNQFKQMVEQKTAEMSTAAAATAAAAAAPELKRGASSATIDVSGGTAGAGVKKLKLRELMEQRAAVLDTSGTPGGSAVQVTPSEELLILKMVLKVGGEIRMHTMRP